MPVKTKPQNPSEAVYPSLEQLIESQDRSETAKLFEQTKARLAELSTDAKAPQAKKALAGIARSEALLSSLHDVREKLEEKARSGKKARR